MISIIIVVVDVVVVFVIVVVVVVDLRVVVVFVVVVVTVVVVVVVVVVVAAVVVIVFVVVVVVGVGGRGGSSKIMRNLTSNITSHGDHYHNANRERNGKNDGLLWLRPSSLQALRRKQQQWLGRDTFSFSPSASYLGSGSPAP